MSPEPLQDHSGLRWIRADLDETLRLARRQLEDFVDEESDRLDECVAYLHQVHGSLEMVQIYGAAMLVDEMEELAKALDNDQITRKDAAVEVLMLGMVQVPAYLEKIECGEPDIPLILLPLMNDLRASRAAPLVSEISLFAPKLDALIAAEVVEPGSGNPELAEIVRQERGTFHRGLLAWYRDIDAGDGLAQIRDVVERVSAVAHTARMRRLLDASEALIVALQEKSIDTSVSVKLLFGQLDRLFKQILDQGEEAVVRDFPLDFLKNQLYYVARSDSENPVIQAVRHSADLANSFPDISVGDGKQGSLGSPGKKLFGAVSVALRADLLSVKDQLDLYIRSDKNDIHRLVLLADPIQRIADTLGMVGRGELRSRLKPHCDRLRSLAAADDSVAEDELMSLASDLLFVESALSSLEKSPDSVARAGMEAESSSPVLHALSNGEYQEHVQAAVDQGFVELARVKDAVVQYLASSHNVSILTSIPDRLHAVSGALVILEQPVAAGLLEDFRGFVRQLAAAEREVPDDEQREALAELVSGVEYYMESLVEGRVDCEHALEVAEAAAQRLGLRKAEESESTAEAYDISELDDRVASADKPALADIDSEIFDIFTEEAREELRVILHQYPRWRENSEDSAALKIIRRSFHTLKGSGRLVGAKIIGEFAWSIESLLNRVIDGSLAVSHDMFILMDDVVEVLPALISEYEQGVSGGTSIEDLQSRAEQLANPAVPEAEAADKAPSREKTVEREISVEAEGESTEEITSPVEDFGNADSELVSDELELKAVPDLSAQESVLSEDSALDVSSLPDTSGSGPEQDYEMDADMSSFLQDDETGSSDIESILRPGSEDVAPIVLEPVLHEIFINESRIHLQTLGSFIENCRGLANGCVFSDELKRGLHTLRGSSHMAQVEPIAALSGSFEKWVNLSSQLAVRTESASIDLLERGHFVLNALLAVINQPGASLPAWQSLQKEVDLLSEQLEMQVAGVKEEGESVDISADAEIVEIFIEEVHELSEDLEKFFGEWQEQPDQLFSVIQLQRGLHTIKGGARLAGIPPIGDLSHGLESVFESVVEHRIDSTPAVRGLARHAMDILATQVDALENGRSLNDQQAMVDRLEAAARGDSWQALESVPDLTDDVSQIIESAADPDNVSEPVPRFDESALLSDSQLSDSELLGESGLLASSLLSDDSLDATVGSILQDDSRIIQFPGTEQNQGTDEPARRQVPGWEEEGEGTSTQESIRVRAELLDDMVNNAGEVSIFRARLEQQNKTLSFNLEELGTTIERLSQQLRGMEIETEAQILARHKNEYAVAGRSEFDPLEMDRYSTIQQLSRALSETVNDLGSIGGSLQELVRDTDTLLLQQARVTHDLQDGLLRTRMVPFSSRVTRLQRVVRQTSHSLDKQAELSVAGGEGEMDRAILERMMAPVEHLLRNAVAHGIESRQDRENTDKKAVGTISLSMEREGADVVISVADDGRGLNRDLIRKKAIERGLLDENAIIDDDDIDQLILEPGFSTADAVSQISGRGVGLDVVLSEVKQLGGALEIDSQPGRGTSFSIRLPFTLAITEALLVQSGEEIYAVPHGSVDGVVRISRAELEACYAGEQKTFEYDDREYTVRYLGTMLGNVQPVLPEGQRWFPVLLVRSGEHRVAVHVNSLLGNRQIVVKTVGAQLSTVRWFTGGTILADGQIALILDVNSLVRMDGTHQLVSSGHGTELQPGSVKVMVVDDSITVRKVTSRLLERHNMQVVTARDGVDAVSVLQDEKPDVMLLDIEMPRMDGFELARHMRSSDELKQIPIIMITSRSGDKHRKHALELGVKRYLGKPFQEADLLENIYTVLAETTE